MAVPLPVVARPFVVMPEKMPELSAREEARLLGMQRKQQARTLIKVNEIADQCFRQCVDDFGFTKYLGSGEEQCLQRCVEKYVKLLEISGASMPHHSYVLT